MAGKGVVNCFLVNTFLRFQMFIFFKGGIGAVEFLGFFVRLFFSEGGSCKRPVSWLVN